tara:strand:+ start:549 stop:977 length:429 start_codon:yes stop_codon:yes gene_type:complete
LFFKKNKNSEQTNFEGMTPIQAVTYLFVFVMLSDNQGSYDEKESWKASVLKLFPDHLESRTEMFFNEACLAINKYEKNKKDVFLDNICQIIKNILDKEKIRKLGPMLNDLIQSDGIVMSSEANAAEIIEKKLDIVIISNYDS